ncbi:MAG: hydroxyisourate hydrolase [Hyphomicrobiales bacterium]|nr:hydroxyisourate hydrolase [Hyphomicrobiales bacterium]MDE2016803.1 hydroxyisourate hydrolase [Hyphomicrobiales bacterium]
MGQLSTHALDTVAGKPAAGMRVELLRIGSGGEATPVAEATTNADGRTDGPLLGPDHWAPGRYELRFHVGAYFAARGIPSPFLDVVPIRFAMEGEGRWHVPLVASPWSYSTYRGS